MLRTDGGYGVPGMPGNGGVYMAGNPSFDIGPRSPFKGMTREQLEELKQFDDRPQDLQQYYDRMNAPGPRLPFAAVPGSSNLFGAIGNMGGMQMAQLPGGEQGPAQGPNTPVKFYPGLGYAPYGPGGGGLPPTPVRGA